MTTELTERQREIKVLLERGMGAREIAEDLGITRNAVYQQIQRLRRYGALEPDFTPTGQPVRELVAPGAGTLARLLMESAELSPDGDASAIATMALAQELRRTRDELASIVRRLSSVLPS